MWMSDRTRAPGPTADERDETKLRELLAAAVLIVEDTIDATSQYTHGQAFVATERTGAAIVNALTEAGWTPPGIATGTSLPAAERSDDISCPQCGGDRRTSNFTGTNWCHVPRTT